MWIGAFLLLILLLPINAHLLSFRSRMGPEMLSCVWAACDARFQNGNNLRLMRYGTGSYLLVLKRWLQDSGHSIVHLTLCFLDEVPPCVNLALPTFWLSTSLAACRPVQLLEAVAFLHDHWVVHRDIKLSNLLYTHTGHLKLCDFGLAR